MSLFSKLFRKPDSQPLGMDPLHPEHNPFHTPVPTICSELIGVSANAAHTDPPCAAGNGAPSVQPIVEMTAPDFDSNECAYAHAAATFINLNECY